MLNIVSPPPPQWSVAAAWAIPGLCVVLGGALLFWGRVLNRSFLAAVGAGAGVVLAEPLARRLGLPAAGVGVVAILGLAVFGAVAARIVWAVAGGALVGLVALGVVLSGTLEALPATSRPAFETAAATDLQSWVLQGRRFLVEAVGAVWLEHSGAILWALCLGGGVPVVILLLLPRLGRILMTALVGSVGLVGGLLLGVSRVHSAVWPARWSGYILYAGIALVLLMFSLVYQYCGDVAARQARKQAEDEAEGAETEGREPPRKAAPHGRKHKP